MNAESVLNAEVVEKLSYTDGMMKKTEICTFGLLLYTPQYKSFPENRGSEMRVSGSESRIGGAS